MKRSFMAIVVSLFFSLVAALWFPEVGLGNKVPIFYTISGIMFSVGMSVAVTSPYSRIPNAKIRDKIARDMKRLRANYLWMFATASAVFMFMGDVTLQPVMGAINIHVPMFATSIMALAIIYFVVNFIAAQKLNDSIETALR